MLAEKKTVYNKRLLCRFSFSHSAKKGSLTDTVVKKATFYTVPIFFSPAAPFVLFLLLRKRKRKIQLPMFPMSVTLVTCVFQVVAINACYCNKLVLKWFHIQSGCEITLKEISEGKCISSS